MNEKLVQAKEAIAAGEPGRAQILLAQLLKAEPGNADAWFLLSGMAISPEQEETFLRKVLSLAPAHEGAQTRLAALEAGDDEDPAGPDPTVEQEPVEEEPLPPTMPVSTRPLDYVAQAEGDTIPPWLADEETVFDARPDGAPTHAEMEPAGPALVDTIPDWVQASPGENWLEEEEKDKGIVWRAGEGPPPTAPTKPANAETDAQPQPRQKQTAPAATSPSPLLLYGLTLAVIVVFLLIVYVMLNFVSL